MKFKKIVAVVSSLCMMTAVMPFSEKYVPETAVSASAEEYTENTYENLKYKKYADYIEISSVTNKEITKAVIPSEINGLPVTNIGKQAFSYCLSLTSVTLPESVTSLENFAFSYCLKLSSVNIPENATSIGKFTFAGCSDLKYISVPKNVKNIGEYAFSNCTGLKSITIENPECEIIDDSHTICSNLEQTGSYYGTIYGYKNSTAQAYAEKYGYKFEAIASAPKTSESETESQAEEILSGDADGNGTINILDVISINKAILGKETLAPEQLKAIDFNHNDKPDSEESLTILKYIVGLVTSFTE